MHWNNATDLKAANKIPAEPIVSKMFLGSIKRPQRQHTLTKGLSPLTMFNNPTKRLYLQVVHKKIHLQLSTMHENSNPRHRLIGQRFNNKNLNH